MSFPTSDDHFPIEIFETIIDFLANQEKSLPSIKACSLVCHNFLPITRKYLFHTFTLKNTASPGWTPNRLVSLITRTSDIAKYVHKLKFYIHLEDLYVKGLPETLKNLTMLKRLTIFQEDAWSWNEIPLPLKDALFRLFCLPTLSHLTLGPINDFAISDLIFHSNLKYLNIVPVVKFLAPTYCQPSAYYEDQDHRYDDLQAGRNADGMFIIDLSIHNVIDLQPGIDLGGKTKAVFTHCSQLMDIRTFKFDYGREIMLIKGFADTVLPALQTLQHLYIYATAVKGCNDVLGGLPAELDIIARKNIIESISIFLTIEIDWDVMIGHEWSELDWALTQHRPGWPNLKKVTLSIEASSYYKEEGDLEEAFKKLPESHLQGLARSEDIKLDFEGWFNG